MATKEFIIRIRNETGSGGGAGDKVGGAGGIAKKTGAQTQEMEYDPKVTVAGVLADRLAKMLAPAAILGGTKRVVDSVANYQHSLIEVRTGSKEQQQRVTFAYNTASGFVGSVVSGAMSGLAFTGGNPAGAVAGIILGVTQQAGSMLIDYALNSATLAEQRTLESMQQSLAAQRVTVSGSRFMNANQWGV